MKYANCNFRPICDMQTATSGRNAFLMMEIIVSIQFSRKFFTQRLKESNQTNGRKDCVIIQITTIYYS